MPKKGKKGGKNKNRTLSKKDQSKNMEETKENQPKLVNLSTGLLMKIILGFFDLK